MVVLDTTLAITRIKNASSDLARRLSVGDIIRLEIPIGDYGSRNTPKIAVYKFSKYLGSYSFKVVNHLLTEIIEFKQI